MEAVINRHLEGLLVNELLLIRLLNVNPIAAATVVQMKNPTQDSISLTINHRAAPLEPTYRFTYTLISEMVGNSMLQTNSPEADS